MNYLLAVIAAVVLVVFGLAWLNESQANRITAQAQAQSVLIRAESDARFRDSQSTTLMYAAVLPLVMVVAAGAVGVLIAVAFIIIAIKWQPRRLIESRVVFQIEAGQPRRELWQAMAAAKTEALIIEGERR